MNKAIKKSLSFNYLIPLLLLAVITSVVLNVWFISHDNRPRNMNDYRSNEQIVRDMLIYRESYSGLTLQQAEEKAKNDNLLYRVYSRNGEPIPQNDMRITPVGSVVAGFALITDGKGRERVQGVNFMGEVSHFEYLDILRSQGQTAASDYAQKHNLH